MKLGVIGTGYVGLVAGAGFADFGNDVICVDIDEKRVAGLMRGELPIHEPGLLDLLKANSAAGRLTFTSDFATIGDAEVVLICVGTPTGTGPGADGNADLSQVERAAQAVAKSMNNGFTVVVIKSTVPVGTSEKVFATIASHSQRPFAVVSNPEFLKEGSAVEDFLRPMRVIVGIGGIRPAATESGPAATERVQAIMRRLYQPVVRTNDRLLFCNSRSAELCKYASNAYLAMRVSFINDIANLCERVGADVEQVRRGMGMDTRIGPSFLFPGIGYGGSCFPKDTRALLACARSHQLALPLIEATERINQNQRYLLAEKILRHFGHDEKIAADAAGALAGKTIAVWGLSFKPETDDTRESPALALIERLCELGAKVRASDPVALQSADLALGPLRERGQVELCSDAYEAAHGADALCLCTEWRQYRQPNFRRLKQLLRSPAVFDGRNIWDRDQLRELGFHYYGVGR